MSIGTDLFTISSGEQGLYSFLQRVLSMDANAVARLAYVAAPEEVATPAPIDVFVPTPFGVVASRRFVGSLVSGTEKSMSVPVAAVLKPGHHSQLNTQQAAWLGQFPPTTGFLHLDDIPIDVAHQLADQGRALARQFSGPLGPPASLLEQKVIRVQCGEEYADIPMRMIFTCTALGFIPRSSTNTSVPRHLRVSRTRRWVRVDAPFGTVYHAQSMNLLRVNAD
ncbi:hypothetical protein EML15_03415 [Corynebacterium sp. sy017]|uniref:hypothetical protein n=1 Tax=unclassified Corynebacterium TaxID=2624378 RepID=UPI001186D63F|nr:MULTISPECIES: hypothetical protein [unclassified Corynebacterium]MBP3088199.1 hypothetical protein [Corynebacterium sp. sy017]TSD92701.1 hypothetical protein ELY17_03415 [Corynebacterium sp. SY003]